MADLLAQRRLWQRRPAAEQTEEPGPACRQAGRLCHFLCHSDFLASLRLGMSLIFPTIAIKVNQGKSRSIKVNQGKSR
jgi:hypothetical protein